jgi:hypothetical protein
MANAANWGKRPTSKSTTQTPPTVDEFVNGGPKKTVRLNILLSPELHLRVKIGCVNEKTTMTDLITEFLESRFPK